MADSPTPNIDPFYMYVAVGALVLLILVLTALGIMMTYLQSTTPFPPTQNSCPDYWDASASNPDLCKFPLKGNTNNGGIDGIEKREKDANGNQYINASSGTADSWHTKLKLQTDDTPPKYFNIADASAKNETRYAYIQLNNIDSGWSALYPGKTVRCAQQAWAIENGLVWDGVTNYNGCG